MVEKLKGCTVAGVGGRAAKRDRLAADRHGGRRRRESLGRAVDAREHTARGGPDVTVGWRRRRGTRRQVEPSPAGRTRGGGQFAVVVGAGMVRPLGKVEDSDGTDEPLVPSTALAAAVRPEIAEPFAA